LLGNEKIWKVLLYLTISISGSIPQRHSGLSLLSWLSGGTTEIKQRLGVFKHGTLTMPAFETGIVFKLVGSKRLTLDEESSYHDGHQTRPQDKEFNNW
jgi:hypothetical protein